MAQDTIAGLQATPQVYYSRWPPQKYHWKGNQEGFERLFQLIKETSSKLFCTLYEHAQNQLMDFLTSFPYWGILVIVIVNAFIVSRMDIQITDENE